MRKLVHADDRGWRDVVVTGSRCVAGAQFLAHLCDSSKIDIVDLCEQLKLLVVVELTLELQKMCLLVGFQQDYYLIVRCCHYMAPFSFSVFCSAFRSAAIASENSCV